METLEACFKSQGVWSLIPRCCVVCQKWPSHGLCACCYELFRRQAVRCRCCGIELPRTPLQICGKCVSEPFAFDEVIAAVSFQEPWKSLIYQFKFAKATEHAGVMAQMIFAVVNAKKVARPDMILPVASVLSRLKERGYNPSWEIAKRLAARMQVPARSDVLKRPYGSQSQTHLKKMERFKALKNAFIVPLEHRHLLEQKHIVIVDDVMTTGATLQAVAKTLKCAGAAKVSGWVFARTPEQRNKR